MPDRTRSGRPDTTSSEADELIAAVVADSARRGRWAALRAAGRVLAGSVGVDLEEAALGLYQTPDGGDAERMQTLLPPPDPAGRARSSLTAALTMGACLEALLAPDERDAGAHHTPPWLAEQVVALALDGLGPDDAATVCDPACGGGVFAVTAAEALLRRRVGDGRAPDVARADVARSVWAFDADPLAVAVTEVALTLWAGAGVGGGPGDLLVEADFLLDAAIDESCPAGGWDVVVGNPPFQSQLTTSTARTRDRAAELRARYHAAAGGYVDEAALFVLAAAQRLGPRGRLAMIVPTALASTAHAAPVRQALAEWAAMTSLWVLDEQPFAASVDVMVPVLAAGRAADTTTVYRSSGEPSLGVEAVAGPAMADPGSVWADLVASAWGVPEADLMASPATLGDEAAVTAGFRQHFYAIADSVRESDPDEPTDRPVLTVGLVDPLRSRWGRASTRIGGTPCWRPAIADGAIDDDEIADWLEDRRRPKVLVATQSRVLEAVVDGSGAAVPCTPLISVEPDDPDDVWLIAAALCAPPVSAWLHRRAAGAGLSRDRIRPTASLLRKVPFPADAARWAEGADLARRASATEDPTDHRRLLVDLGVVMADAYGAIEGVVDWWAARLPPPR